MILPNFNLAPTTQTTIAAAAESEPQVESAFHADFQWQRIPAVWKPRPSKSARALLVRSSQCYATWANPAERSDDAE
ncbi:uncharacterized protein N7459_008683 [Penicillium hispanicum]|uniref:uncharacterized protein n=1 Tax=Penicillium hispanicum TaxID=1080232 RepID=UPI0025422525|nr:uncharacterized protein N7459_008683 [Penicillium hispanicum]KAJ5574256.1 hypothetical protein N7459_008683 [Penicillium hispanicum]